MSENTNLIKKISAPEATFLYSDNSIKLDELKGRIVLLDFWTYCCINCIQTMPEIKKIEDKYGSKVTVIGIHSGKFSNEKDDENIRSAIKRYKIEHPVINDADYSIWQSFGVRAWPTLLLIAPNGKVASSYSGEGNRLYIERDIERLLEKFPDTITTPLAYHKKGHSNDLKGLYFPSKLVFGGGKLFISDSGNNRIVVTDLDGNVLDVIGNNKSGDKDGNFGEAEVNAPQGLLYRDNLLYIADTANNKIKLADINKKQVTTIAGNGKRGFERLIVNQDAKNVSLASPWDLAFYPDNNSIVIANAGSHQLLEYKVKTGKISIIAGNGQESIDDGRYPFNSLSQPSGLYPYGDKLYFVDSETSSLRTLDGLDVKTLVGSGLFTFGLKDGKGYKALLQHPLGLFVDKNGVWIADTYNHAIRKFTDGEVTTIIGGERGDTIGNKDIAKLNEPNAIIKIADKYYISDTNNHKIKVFDGNKLSEFELKFK